MSPDPIRSALPKDRHDISGVAALVQRGYPAVAPILGDLFEWLGDYNWPVARALAPFLASLGQPILPEVRRILATDDQMWKYWVLTAVVARLERSVATQLLPELKRLATLPTPGEVKDEVDMAAREILAALEAGA
jgi:hypothetical protein